MRSPFTSILSFVNVVLMNRSVISQLLPCPAPGFEDAMKTQEDCDCFYAFASSDILNEFEKYYAEDSYFYFGLTGKYYGPESIREYADVGAKGEFSTLIPPSDGNYLPLAAFMYASSIGEGECELLVVNRLNFEINTKYTENNQEGCADISSGTKLKYSLTGNPRARISIQSHDAWLSNIYTNSFFALTYNTLETAKYVCDKIINTCQDYTISGRKKTRGRRRKLQLGKRREIARCLRKYNALPEMSYSAETGTVGYSDGDSKSCRIFHSNMASINDDHCPHISFEREVDINGFYKCSESEFADPEESFTSDEIDFILDIGVNQFGYPADSPGGVLLNEACPRA